MKCGTGKKVPASTLIRDVSTTLQEMSSSAFKMCSARECLQSLDLLFSTVHKILQNMLQYPYGIKILRLFGSCFLLTC